MQVNLNCNQPRPQFGMAFRRPNDTHLESFSEKLFGNASEYTAQIIRKGLRQLDAEQAQLTRYDIRYNGNDKSIELIDNATDRVIDRTVELSKQTGFDLWGEMRYPGRKLFASIFNPKKFLPRELYYMGEEAKRLEAEAIRKENLTKNLF